MTGFTMRPRGRGRIPMLCALVAMTTVGCADSDKPRTGIAPTLGSPAGAGAGSGGQAGASAGVGGSAQPGAGGRGAQAGAAAVQPVVCGGVTCTSTSPRLGACCLPDGGCGLGTGSECQAAEQPGSPDPGCPSHEVTSAGLVLIGCCKPDDQCGVMSMSGLGCVERTQLATFAGGPLDALACGADLDGGVDDAGSEADSGASDDGTDDAEDAGTDESAAGAACPWPPRRPGRFAPPAFDAGPQSCPRFPPAR
jgi:hypothetical protein